MEDSNLSGANFTRADLGEITLFLQGKDTDFTLTCRV